MTASFQRNGHEVSVPEAIAQSLVGMGVDRFFGLMGDDTAAITAGLVARTIEYHDARHENAAVAMAAGYSRACGKLGVCVISRGPGLTNALTAAVNSSRGDASVLIILGDAWNEEPINTIGLPDYKAVDTRALAAASGLPLFSPTRAGAVLGTLGDAASSASGHRTVLFTLPRELLTVNIPEPDAVAREAVVASPEPIRGQAVEVAATVLAGSHRPLIIAGGGAWQARARAEIEELADRIGAVIATTLRGKDMFRGYPYEVGLVGSLSHSVGRRMMEQADCVVAIGASLNRFSTVSGAALPMAPLIHVDSNRTHIGRNHWADVSLVGDAKAVVNELLDLLPMRQSREKPAHDAKTRAEIAVFDPTDDFEPVTWAGTIDPRTLVIELDAMLPAERAIATDVGNFFGFVPSHMSVPDPDHFLLSSDFSSIGLGLGTALGMAIARPDACNVVFIGDGGLLMSLGELESLARQQFPLIVVVMNDGSYGAERHYLRARDLPDSIAVFPRTDFVEVATAWGIQAHTVRSVSELRALGPLLTRPARPMLLDCRVTPTVVAPFLSAG